MIGADEHVAVMLSEAKHLGLERLEFAGIKKELIRDSSLRSE